MIARFIGRLSVNTEKEMVLNVFRIQEINQKELTWHTLMLRYTHQLHLLQKHKIQLWQKMIRQKIHTEEKGTETTENSTTIPIQSQATPDNVPQPKRTIQQDILQVLHSTQAKESFNGLSVTQILEHFPSHKNEEVQRGLASLLVNSDVYTTVDDDHYKSITE